MTTYFYKNTDLTLNFTRNLIKFILITSDRIDQINIKDKTQKIAHNKRLKNNNSLYICIIYIL